MLKKVFWMLLAGNAIFFAAMQWGGLLTAEPDVLPSPSALNEDKVRLLAEVRPISAVSPVSAVFPAAVGESGSCMEWGEFSGADLARATAALGELQLGQRLGRREVEYNIGYWVYIPPLKDKAAVAQKIAQLKARGVTEYFVVQEAGVWLNAISLGVFKTREAAQNFVNQLQAQDVRSAQVGERNSRLRVTVFLLDGLDAATAGKLAALHKDFPGSELRTVSCAH